MHIHISNLSGDTTSEDIGKILSNFNNFNVSKVTTIRNSETKLLNTFAFIHIEDDNQAAAVMSLLNNTTLHNCNLLAKEAS